MVVAPLTTLPHSIFCIPLKNCLCHHDQFAHERKTLITASFEESTGKDTFLICKQKGLKNSTSESDLKANINFVFCAIKIVTIKALMEQFH